MLSYTPTLVQSLLFCFTSYVIWKILRPYVFRTASHPNSLDNVRGPGKGSYLQGNFPQLVARNSWAFQDELGEMYGSVVKFTTIFRRKAILVFDPTALHHVVVKDQHVYEKSRPGTAFSRLVFGSGLLSTSGEVHRRQRKMLNPVFSISHMRRMTPIFYQTIHRLREAISCELNQTADCGQEIDFLNWMGRAALELIGQGGLGYSFDPLVANTENTFGDALKALIPTLSRCARYRFLSHYAEKLGPPRLRRFLISLVPDVNIQELRQIVDIVADRSKEILDGKRKALEDGDEAVNMQVGEGKDIMSILLRQNMKIEDSEKLPEHELLAQMSTFVFAATDTTSNALARIFDLLAQHQHVQDKLRQEILESCDSEDGTFTDLSYDKLVELPYLDAVCRETLRLYPPVSFVTREAERDIVLPLSEPIQGVDGTPMKEILVPNGTTVIIGIRACNRNKAIWGEDALEWKPDRWLDSVPGSVKEARVPGIYANLMTFLGGGRACIGFKFSQLEMKVVLAVLLHSFKFLPSSKGIVWNFAGISYPTVSPVDKKPSMPMRIEPIFRNVVV